MRIKSYFSHSVEEAIHLARHQLGADAMLMNSRQSLAESRHLGEYEVVFGIDTADPVAPAAPPVNDRLAADVADLKRALEEMRLELTRRSTATPQGLSQIPDVSEAYAALTHSEVDADLAHDLVQAASRRPGGISLMQALTEEAESRFEVEPALGRAGLQPRIAAFVGPPGAGKTTALVKLAVQYGLAARRPVLLLSTDTYRIGSADQLRAFAVILGVGFQVADTVTALAQTIEENRGKDLILIDTPGFAPADMENAGLLSRFLSTRTDIDTQLVLPASTRRADLKRIVDAFEIFGPDRLLFTRLDETSSLGPVFSEAARTRKPLSFFSAGQSIPEDIQPASKSRLLDLILPAPSPAAQTAAA